MSFIKNLFLVLFSLAILTSCVSRKKIVYFQELENFVSEDNISSVRFKPNDMLSIVVSASNIESVIPFNLISIARPLMGNRVSDNVIGSSTSMEVPYMVSGEGEIQFPILGTIDVAGKTPKELQDYLQSQLKEYVKDPIVNVRLLNFTVSILGEVMRPGTYSITGERIALPEALGLAGDLSIYGRRDKILIVREVEGKKNYKYLDIRDSDILNSEYYYLQQHDIVYVEPNRAQRQSSSFNRNMPIYVSIASLLLSVLVIIDNR